MIDMWAVGTMQNRVYAFESPPADCSNAHKSMLWCVGNCRKDKVNGPLGVPLPYNYFAMDWWILGHNIDRRSGITATPVIDRKRRMLFVTAKSLIGNRQASYNLFAIDLSSGKIKSRVTISASYSSANGSDSAFNPEYELQPASLLETNDRIYLAFGSHQDTSPFHGWLLAYVADDI